MSPARVALQRFGPKAAIAGFVFGCFTASEHLMPPWLYWGVWGAYVAGTIGGCVWMQYDTRRMERERLEWEKKKAAAVERMIPQIEQSFRIYQQLQEDRVELWRKVAGIEMIN